MEWSVLTSLFQCEMSGGSRVVVLLLGALASLATLGTILYRVYRWFVTDGRHRRAANVLREEGKYRARLNHREQAMDLYDLSIKLNPRAGDVYYHRGLLFEELHQISRAVADWERCVERLPKHAGAHVKLGRYRRHPRPEAADHRWAYISGVAALMLALAILGVAAG